MTELVGEPGVLFDDAARTRIRSELTSTLFVEAGAGSGKTTALVARIVRLLAAGDAELAQIAAITFTEAAAAELRLKLYGALLASDAPDLVAKSSNIDDATITTIHGFAQRILAEHPIEAGLPLNFEVADQIASSVAFEERFAGFLDDLYDDDGAQVLIQALTEFNVRGRQLHAFADELEGSRLFFDLIAEEPVGLARDVIGMVERAGAITADGVDDLLRQRATCTDSEDKLFARVCALEPELDRYRQLPDWIARLGWLRELDLGGANLGSKSSWSDVTSVRDSLSSLRAARDGDIAEIAHVLVSELATRLRRAAGIAARGRVGKGQLSFDDLLVVARDLLRDHPRIRRMVQSQFRFILVDEFQDTDPLQREMLMLLGDAPREAALPSDNGAGRLFFVGDPKQSIYAFRGADVALYADTRDQIAEGDLIRLVTNFRSRPGIVTFVNELFSQMFLDQLGLIGENRAADLVAARAPHDDPAVLLVAGPAEDLSAVERRELDANEIAEVISHAVEARWTVHDASGPRPVRFGDIAILTPTRTSASALQLALDRHGIDFTIAETTLVYAAQEIRDVLGILRAIDETGDERDVIRALRSSCFALLDADLVAWRRAGGAWRLDAATPSGLVADSVAAALARLRVLSIDRHACRLDVLVSRVIDELGIRQSVAVRRSRAEALRRIDFLEERARAFVASTGGTISQFLDFTDREAAGRARSRELISYSADLDAVRIMTIHAAKGLEFPFVVVADLAGDATTMFPAVLAGSASAELSISASVRTSGFNEARQERSRLDREERTRLAYVAMTRARDFLVVMLRHSPGKNSPPTLAEQIWSLSSGLSSCASFDVGAAIARRSGRGASHRVEPAGLLDRAESSPSEPGFTPSVIEQWQETRAELLASVLRKRHVAPSSLGHGSAGDLGDGRERSGVELLLEPDDGDPSRWRRGRQASAKGRAVHAVLERMDLRDPENLELLALGASSDEGIAEEAGEVARLARAALGAPTVQAALESSKLMRELPLRVGIGRGTIEGIIDLCYREEDGLVLVDYKTDALASNESLASAGARYHLQIGAYVLALETATRLVVRRAVLIFLAADGGALEYEVPELGRVVELAKLEVVGALEPDLHVHT